METSHESSERDDETSVLVRRALDGDPQSLERMVERFTPILLAQARFRLSRALGGLLEPEDLVQATWLTALPKLEGFATPGADVTRSLLAFLTRCLSNLYGNLLQKHLGGRPLKVEVPDFGGSSPSRRDEVPLSDPATSIVTRAIRRELGEAFFAGLDALDEGDAEIIVLRGIEQVPNRQAAAILGLKANTVAARYRRALARLREHLPRSVWGDLCAD